jgi:shikimate dehydrogenase
VDAYGLIGHPVKHSYSAFMHEAAFAYYGMEAVYTLMDIAPEDLGTFFTKDVFGKKLKGFNVTIPHKERAVDFLTGSASRGVMMTRALNTVRVDAGDVLSGTNTDGPGFARDLKERGLSLAGKRVALIGAGGGAKSVATALALEGASAIAITDVDREKRDDLCDIVRENFSSVKVEPADRPDGLKVQESSLLVNATPVGMKPSDPLLVPQEVLHRDLFVYDLIYNPCETKLLQAARAAGCRTANGLGMLLHQGCLAFEFWTGKPAPVDVMRKALENHI